MVEIDGIHHSWAENVVDDAARHNEIALRRSVVLRIPLLGLRVDPDTFFGRSTEHDEEPGGSPRIRLPSA